MYMVSEYYAPIHRAYDELLAKGLEKKLLDNSRRQCLHELDSVALRTALSADVEKRIDDIVGQRLQSVAAEVAHITTFDELEKYSQCFSQTNPNVCLYVPKGCIDLYRKASGWNRIKNMSELKDSNMANDTNWKKH